MQAFFYVDGDTAKGAWVDMTKVDCQEDVLEALAEKGLVARDKDGRPEYGGDLLVADYDGPLVKAFLGRGGVFDIDGFVQVRDFCTKYGYPYEAAAAYVENVGSWSEEQFPDAFVGHYDSLADFAKEDASELGAWEQIPDYLKDHIDWEGVARDLLYGGDIWVSDAEDGGVFVFRSF